MPSAKTQPARGMRDFLPEDVRKREYVISVIKEVYERYGFEPLETPAVENIETLMGKYGEEGNQLIFKILKRGVHESTGEADLALRYDLTVPLARVVAEYRDKLPKFFKRYQIQPVWRADRPARGRFREFYQCDVDVLGSRSMVVEAEICAAASEALTKLGFTEFTIRLNHRKLLEGILEKVGLPVGDRAQALVALDKLDKIGLEGVVREFRERGIAEETSWRLARIFNPPSPEEREMARESWNYHALEQVAAFLGDGAATGLTESHARQGWNETQIRHELMNLVGSDEAGRQGVGELLSIVALCVNNSARGRVKIDTSLVRGLSYYTGAIMEIVVEDLSGSLGGGGRYDNLVGMFRGEDVPACGFSLGLERIIVVMTEREMFPAGLIWSPAEVMVALWNEESISESIALASELRAQNLRVDVYLEADKLGKQFKYASARGIPFVAVIGDDERTRGEVSIKDMRSGEQQSVRRSEVVGVVRNRERSERVASTNRAVDPVATAPGSVPGASENR